MKLLIQIIFLVIPLAFSAPAFAQDYTISEKSDRINSAKYDGYAIQVSGPLEKVTDQIYNYLKERSKVRRKRNYYSVTEFKMDKLSLDSTEVFLKISDKDNGSQLWMATETLGLKDERVDFTAA